jgi:hypothetical protein
VGHKARVTSIAFSRDGATLISGSEDGTALMWDVRGVLKPEIAKEADEERLWRLLASADSVAPYEAGCALAKRRDPAFISRHPQSIEAPDAATMKKINQYVADLNSDDFATREKAQSELSQLEDLAEAGLRKALADGLSPEARRRVKALLDKLEEAPPSAKTLQGLRSIESLESIATPEARRLLRKLADDFPSARLKREARASLERLARRNQPKP